jgi:hypothetical protein
MFTEGLFPFLKIKTLPAIPACNRPCPRNHRQNKHLKSEQKTTIKYLKIIRFTMKNAVMWQIELFNREDNSPHKEEKTGFATCMEAGTGHPY